MAHVLGYARVSTTDQNPDLHLNALKGAGCFRVFVDWASGALDERPELTKALDQLARAINPPAWWRVAPTPAAASPSPRSGGSPTVTDEE